MQCAIGPGKILSQETVYTHYTIVHITRSIVFSQNILREGKEHARFLKKSLMSVSADLATAVLSIRSGSLFIRDPLYAVNRGPLE